MLKASDVMSKNPQTIRKDMPVADAVRILLEKNYNGLPVVDDTGAMVGILCQSDLITQQKRLKLPSFFTLLDSIIPLGSTKHLDEEVRRMAAVTAGEAMTAAPVTVTPDTPLDEVASLMVEAKYYTLPVVQDGTLVGVIGKEDILRTLVK